MIDWLTIFWLAMTLLNVVLLVLTERLRRRWWRLNQESRDRLDNIKKLNLDAFDLWARFAVTHGTHSLDQIAAMRRQLQ